jgi:hypothetical protein
MGVTEKIRKSVQIRQRLAGIIGVAGSLLLVMSSGIFRVYHNENSFP